MFVQNFNLSKLWYVGFILVNELYPIVRTPTHLEANFFCPEKFLGPKAFFDQKFFAFEIFVGPKNFFWRNLFLTQNNLGLNFILTTTFFWLTIFFGIIIFLEQKFCRPKRFLNPNFFWTKNFLGPKIFWTQHFSGSKLFSDQKSFLTNKFLEPEYSPNFFWTNFFSKILFLHDQS